MPAPSRGSTRPDQLDAFRLNFDQNRPDGSPGPFGQFRENYLVRMFNRGPGDHVKIEPLGVQEWTFEQKSYLIRRLYRISNEEGMVEAIIPVRSSEAMEEGETRKWFVSLREAAIGKPTPNPLGMIMGVARLQVQAHLQKMIKGTGPENYRELDKTAWTRVAPKEQLRRHLQSQMEILFTKTTGEERNRIALNDPGLCPWEKVGEGVRIHFPFKVALPPGDGLPSYQVDGTFLVDSQLPLKRANLDKMTWKITALEFHRTSLIPKGPPGKQ